MEVVESLEEMLEVVLDLASVTDKDKTISTYVFGNSAHAAVVSLNLTYQKSEVYTYLRREKLVKIKEAVEDRGQ